MLLMIDNFDSFTYNIVQYFEQLQQSVQVITNNAVTIEQLEAMSFDAIVIGPGPCTPSDSGISLQAIEHFAGKVPILGICLGHQAIAQVYGASIIRAAEVMHGRTSFVYHHQQGIFANIASPFLATRYHSLVIDKNTLADTLEVTAWTEDEAGMPLEIMGIRHRQHCIEGVQFHPESILSESGFTLLNNFLLHNNLGGLPLTALPSVALNTNS
ncbi:anthranilate synthase component II [Psychrobacter sp. I-STPA6b]|uniref:anthranilate synthase component II n=1 Tax=Psychrobacter sp. I-STPA6b TaxID=2585718 RepID=UPI001D0C3BCE|nr:aminodeoxychorismate/anthranilate synthase component II [Psychrobacter sp. I-STPA6b]